MKLYVRFLVLSLCLLLVACRQTLELHTGLSESDANEIVAALVEHGVAASKDGRQNDVTVRIRESDISRAVQVLNARGLPARNRHSLGDVFKKEGLISTPMEERARYVYALSQELEYTLSQIQDVIVARVHVVLPEKVAPGEAVQLSSAAVFIKHLPGLDPDVARPRIREMVARSIPGLASGRTEDISVVFMPAEPAQSHLQWTAVGPFKVDVASAGALRFTAGLMVLLLVGTLAVLIATQKERITSWLRHARRRLEQLIKPDRIDP